MLTSRKIPARAFRIYWKTPAPISRLEHTRSRRFERAFRFCCRMPARIAKPAPKIAKPMNRNTRCFERL